MSSRSQQLLADRTRRQRDPTAARGVGIFVNTRKLIIVAVIVGSGSGGVLQHREPEMPRKVEGFLALVVCLW